MKTNTSVYRFKYSYLFLLIMTFAGLQTNIASAKTASIGSAVNWGNVDIIVVNRKVHEPSVTEASLKLACVFHYTESYICIPPALLLTNLKSQI
ncbi:hypothetical protein [Flavobacterium pectinovorum]|uniref:hypothetical protein n=1 Tax=Flavobacterium pectinovorum TaxID=29533 RepID=UPI001FACE00D|nr:hypothetical protein [Flavobacterium pectinovorum]MCI9846839.1 hypothetical protein [Flavobacterium pectinovorum]